MEDVRKFGIHANFDPKPAPAPYDAQPESELVPISVALRRFRHAYFYSTAVMKAGDHEDHLELPFELAYVLNQLPQWLGTLAKADGKAGLMFGGQGSERELIADRNRETITYWFRPFFSDGNESPKMRVSVQAFIREWIAVARKLMEKLVELLPTLAQDPEFQALRAALDNIIFKKKT